MSQGCALLILRSKGQRSRSWRMVIWKWFPDDNWLCNQPMIMKLHTLTHHESRMRPIDFEVKGQGHGAWLFENGFRTITDSVINLWSWNFIHLLPMSQGCALLILGSKGQRSRSWRMVIWKWSTEIMVADLNLLGSVGDLYCFSNTFSMLLYVAPICCPSCFKYEIQPLPSRSAKHNGTEFCRFLKSLINAHLFQFKISCQG